MHLPQVDTHVSLKPAQSPYVKTGKHDRASLPLKSPKLKVPLR